MWHISRIAETIDLALVQAIAVLTFILPTIVMISETETITSNSEGNFNDLGGATGSFIACVKRITGFKKVCNAWRPDFCRMQVATNK